MDVLDPEVKPGNISAEVIGPSGPVFFDLDLEGNATKRNVSSKGGFFRADEFGMHEVVVTNEGEPVKGTPHYLRAMPKSKKDYEGENS